MSKPAMKVTQVSDAATGTPPGSPRREPARSAKAPKASGAADIFVLAAIAAVSMAIGLGSYAQLGCGIGVAACLAMAALLALSSLHVALRRSQSLAELTAENARLKSKVEGLVRVRRMMPQAPAAKVPTAAAHEPRMPADAVAAEGLPSVAAQAPPAPASLVPTPAEEPTDASPPSEADLVQSIASVKEQWALRPGFARAPALAGPSGVSDEASRGDDTTATGSVPLADGAIVVAAPPVRAEAPAEARISTSRVQTVTAPSSPTAASAQPSDAAAVENPRKPRADFDAIQALIKRLATDLNAPRKPEPPEEPSSPATEPAETAADPQVHAQDAITRSVVALRHTGAAMRRAEMPDEAIALQVGRQAAVPAAPPSAPAAGPQSPPPLDPVPSVSLIDAITEAVAADRYDVMVEPIQSLKDRKARHFEIGLRLIIQNGTALDDVDYVRATRGTELLARIDAAKMLRTARFAEHLLTRGKSASVHSAISGDSLASDAFLDDFAATLEGRGQLAHVLVLGFSQIEVRSFSPVHWETLHVMADLGLRFSLEHVTDLDMDFESLKGSGFEFVKLDAEVFLDGLQCEGTLVPAADLCRHLSELGLSLVVSHIADDRALAKILGFGVLLGQGELFGRPRRIDMDGSARVAA
ncbi:MAG TPA: EAL domain-containing protein [Hyphomicrobiaceae bacterium]|nr:EAL domain-containing protein [Hyphomicrobiaceae bacterium]